MKTIAIGDVHGRDLWKKFIEMEPDADRLVFIGDYFDSFDIPAPVQIENFREIVAFKKENPEKVVLLIGNHDFHYMPEAGTDRYSGYNEEYGREIGLNIMAARRLMKMVHIEGNYLFSHAGVTNEWLKHNGIEVDKINETNLSAFRFNRLDTSGYGNHKVQSPIWVRPQALVPDAQLDYVQVVGHTHQPQVTYYNGQFPARVVMIDCQDQVEQYLIVEDGQPRTGGEKLYPEGIV